MVGDVVVGMFVKKADEEGLRMNGATHATMRGTFQGSRQLPRCPDLPGRSRLRRMSLVINATVFPGHLEDEILWSVPIAPYLCSIIPNGLIYQPTQAAPRESNRKLLPSYRPEYTPGPNEAPIKHGLHSPLF